MLTLSGLRDARDEVLRAEIAALLHNIGKLDERFVKGDQGPHDHYSHKWFVAPENLCVLKPELKEELLKDTSVAGGRRSSRSAASEREPSKAKVVSKLRKGVGVRGLLEYTQSGERLGRCELVLAGECWPIGELLTLFWDDFCSRPDPYQRKSLLEGHVNSTTGLPILLALAHGEVSAAKGPNGGLVRPSWDGVRCATAFGHEEGKTIEWLRFHDARHELLSLALEACERPPEERGSFICKAARIMAMGVGDTRRPINDITLWDYSWSIAALFKAAAAKAVIENKVPAVEQMRWSLLSVSFDGSGFVSQAHGAADMLGRKRVLDRALDRVRRVLEWEVPLGNEVYRDENGSVFVVPFVGSSGDAQNSCLLDLETGSGPTLHELLLSKFDGGELGGELLPAINAAAATKGSELQVTGATGRPRRAPAASPDPEKLDAWWGSDRPANAAICPVCGVRPVGYPATGSPVEGEWGLSPWANEETARRRGVCQPCLHRRGGRAKEWLTSLSRQQVPGENVERHGEVGLPPHTMWMDEAADDNARLALVVGRFDLKDWLSGRLISTITGKQNSFTQVRRCWQTTLKFWDEVMRQEVPAAVGREGRRLLVMPTEAGVAARVSPYHAYELAGDSRAFLALAVVWDPERQLLVSAANLGYVANQLQHPPNDAVAALVQRLKSQSLALREPGSSGKAAFTCADVREDPAHYHPFIPLFAEPALFMAIVPADKALHVLDRVKEKYRREMARVADRLPLHAGLVFARRTTPLRAILEAGEGMLARRQGWEKWKLLHEVKERCVTLNREGQTLRLDYPKAMGDGTEDKWYANLVIREPGQEGERDASSGVVTLPVEGLDKLTGSNRCVWLKPATFDFEFLDSTARRYEVVYDSRTGRRLGRPTRPYLLYDLDRLESLWRHMKDLNRSQIIAVIGAIEEARRDWRVEEPLKDVVFVRFVEDTLASAHWEPEAGREGGWLARCEAEREALVVAGARGELADLVELHLQIVKEG